MSELRPERLEVLVGREVALGLGPGGDRVDDPVDELLDAALPLRRPDMTTEVLADDDVRGQLAPEGGDLDVGLLEDGLARLAGDVGSPELPGDLVVRMDVRAGPAARELQALGAGSGEARAVRAAEPARVRPDPRPARPTGRPRRLGGLLGLSLIGHHRNRCSRSGHGLGLLLMDAFTPSSPAPLVAARTPSIRRLSSLDSTPIGRSDPSRRV